MSAEEDALDDHEKGFYIVGGIVFLLAWLYAVVTYGLFLGLGLGWLPALVIGFIAGILWPFILLLLLGLAAYAFYVSQYG